MPHIIQSALVFVLVLGTLILIHEFGHYIVARMFGVRIEVFSVGFGKRLIGWRGGHTDYRISLMPLGGYVQMAGESSTGVTTGADYEFVSKPKWQRLLVALAGPAMNILLSLALPAALAMLDNESPAYLAAPAVIQAADPGSPAERAGIRTGDLVLSAGSATTPNWQALEDYVALRPGQSMALLLARDGETRTVMLDVERYSLEGQAIGYSGLKPDLGRDARLTFVAILPDSPAERAGLQPGDQLVAIDGEGIEQSFYGRYQSIRKIRGSQGATLTFTVLRGEYEYYLDVTPRLQDGVWRVGFQQGLTGIEMASTRLGPVAALKQSFDANLRVLSVTGTAISQVFSGERSVRETFAGPVQIFEYSGNAAERGMPAVVHLMSVLSLNLGLFNLLPIPVLDGGLIFMLLLEWLLGLAGLPLTVKFKERMLQIGAIVLIVITSFALLNDVSNIFSSRSHRQESGPDSSMRNK